MESLQALPPFSSLSSSSLSFLDAKLGAVQDLAQASGLVSELQTHCHEMDRGLAELNRSLELALAAYASFSDRANGLFASVNARLTDIESSVCSRSSLLDGEGGGGGGLGEDLPALAKEVARLETVRAYAETALVLDRLVGDIEDAVSSIMSKHRKHSVADNSEEILATVNTLTLVEDNLTSVTKTRPQWAHLVSAVDHRVDRALAILRPQAVADHRALLTSLEWPPPLSHVASLSPDANKSSEVPNFLFAMQGDLKYYYSKNFLALCRLQELQRCRKSRQLEGHNREVALHQPLWAIEELVNPIAVASVRHFTKWIDRPEFIFALVYKITQDFVNSMDELLQPLVDEAMLAGYSCREEWISAMVASLSTYLAKEMFPNYVSQLEEERATGVQSQARTSWLHLIDLMFSFDKRIKSLVEQSGILLSLQDDRTLQKISSLSVFSDRPDWLDLWAEIELADTMEKLKSEVDNERNWSKKVKGAVLYGSSDYRSPAVSSGILRHLSSLIDRCRSLPTISLRSRFIRLAGGPIIKKFVDCLALRCQEAEGLTALTDNDAIIKVVNCINAARYVESVLREWCEDVFFLEMESDQTDEMGIPLTEHGSSKVTVEEFGSGGIFEKEIGKLEELRTEWAEKISIVVLRGFDARCRDYLKNRKQWQEKSDDDWTVTKTLVGALDYLQGKMSVIEENLNSTDFVSVWRSLAAGVDKLLLNGILTTNVKFHDSGVERLGHDLEVLFGVFGSWCLRPEGFFPRSSEGLKLLKMREGQLKNSLARGENWLKENGIRHLSVAEAEKIVKNRVFS